MADKTIIIYGSTGVTYKCIIRRRSDGYLMDPTDGVFKAAASIVGTTRLSLAEDANTPGYHVVTEARALWLDGLYDVAVYEGVYTDAVGGYDMKVKDDAEVEERASLVSLLAQMAVIAGGNMSRPYVALQRRITTSGGRVNYPQGDEVLMTMHVDDSWTLTVTQKIYLCVKKNYSDVNAAAIINRLCTFVDAQTVTITPTDAETDVTPGDYIAEIEVRDANDDNPQTAMQFTFAVIPTARQ